MTGQDIINAGKAKTRNTPLLYSAYLELFREAFGRTPECPTCGSAQGNKDWAAFSSYIQNNNLVKTEKTYEMATTFSLRDRQKIYSYDYKHKNGRILRARTWGHSMTEDFALAYLENAIDEKQLAERKAEFKTLPSAIGEAEKSEGLEALTKAELIEKLIPTGADLKTLKALKKNELIALIEAQEATEETTKVEEVADEAAKVEETTDETAKVEEVASVEKTSDDLLD